MLRLRDDLAIVQTVDFFAPVVDDPWEFGAIASANSMSDVFAMGGTVTMGLNIAAFPDNLNLRILSEIFRGGSETLARAGAVIAGGHTVTDDEPKYGVAVTGLIDPARIWTKAGARPGDALLLTKPLGSGVLTTAAKQDRIGRAELEPAIAWMLRLNLQARDLAHPFTIHAATDITGFGLAGHAWEMADRSEVAIHLDLHGLPVLPHALDLLASDVMADGLRRNREHYTALAAGVTVDASAPPERVNLAFDPQTSGGLLFAVPPADLDGLLATFAAAEAPIWQVGTVTEGQGVHLAASSGA